MAVHRTAHCTCGQLQACCTGEPVRNSICFCLACKQRTGSAFSWNATFMSEQVTLSGDFASFTRHSDEGRWCRYRFCPRCGATVFYEIEARPGKVSVPVGAFADPLFPRPTVSVHTAGCEFWLSSEGGLPEAER